MREPTVIYCTYHGPVWMELVEQGWVTTIVTEAGMARMVRA